jgi:nucleoside-diphosphate-sugar epimerase
MNSDKKIILITGCSGRIGSWAVERFAKAGYTVVGWDYMEPKTTESMDFYRVDITSDEDVAEKLQALKMKYGEHLSSVIHLIAYYSFAGEHPELYEKITVKGTERLLRGLRSFRVEQFIFSSTQLVYAPCEVGEKIREDSPLNPQWDYPKSKIITEKLIFREHGDIPVVILRIAGCYDDECHSIPIAQQIQRIYEHQFASRVYPGDLSHGSPFVHLEDLDECLWLCVEKRKELPHELILLIGEDKTMSYEEMQNEIFMLIDGRKLHTYHIPKWAAKLGAWILCHVPHLHYFIHPWMIDIADNHYSLDISKAKQLLGWQPKHFVGDTIPVMIDFLKKDPKHWYKTNDL